LVYEKKLDSSQSGMSYITEIVCINLTGLQ